MRTLIVLILMGILSGCAAAQLSLEKRDLNVQTRTSNTIFLAPVESPSPKLFLNIRSSVADFEGKYFRNTIGRWLGANNSGYTLTEYPSEADYLMSVSVSNLEKVSLTAAEKALQEGYGGPSITNSLLELSDFKEIKDTEDIVKTFATILFIGAVEGAINSSVKDVSFMLITDVEVAERLPPGYLAEVDTKVSLTNGDAASITLTEKAFSELIKYRTRIVTTANRANLELEDAKGKMFDQMAYAIAGIFAKTERELAGSGVSELKTNTVDDDATVSE